MDTAPEPTCTKVYYASRTHSQLAQVLHELEKLKIDLSPVSVRSLHPDGTSSLPSSSNVDAPKRSISMVDDDDGKLEAEEQVVEVRAVSLGSRKQLCINETLKSKAGDLDEACRQLLSGERRLIMFISLIVYLCSHREGRQTMPASPSDG